MKQDNVGQTVLHCAVQQRQLEALSLLFDACSNTDVLSMLLLTEDNKGQTVISLVRCVGGDSLMSVVTPYCTKVRHQFQHK
jgi:hypothetical protein